MVKWTEVSAYSGMPVDEDAPTNATGAAVAGTTNQPQAFEWFCSFNAQM